MPLNHPDRLLPTEGNSLARARELFASVKDLPLICPHGHVNPAWFSNDEAFTDATSLLVTPDHYVLRMLVSQGVSLDDLGVARTDGSVGERDQRKIWRLFAARYYLFQGTPTRQWLDHTFEYLFDLTEPLSAKTADLYFDQINACLADPQFKARALYERFNIEVLATTEGALDSLEHHHKLRSDGWSGRIVTTYRPDQVTDPDFEEFAQNIELFGELAGQNVSSWHGYLQAHRVRRAFFRDHGATATDHGLIDAHTQNLSTANASALYDTVISGRADASQRARFRGQMITEMAKMSVEDGMVMQVHPGSLRNHSPSVFARFGRDQGFDIPTRTDYVHALQPLLKVVGMQSDLTIILFTLDESTYSRELAPLAGVYPCLKLGPAWWFHDSAEGMKRFRQLTTETAGFYNTVGFNDDTRAFPSIPARHDVARRIDCGFLASLVADHRLRETEAYELAYALSYGLAKTTYKYS